MFDLNKITLTHVEPLTHIEPYINEEDIIPVVCACWD